MTDPAALLAAVVAAPADDLPRLVFADWLDEHGDPDRAEFIRAQIAGPSARADALLAANKARWEVPGLRGVQVFRRGFVEGVRMRADEFVAHADRLGRLAPITAVRLDNAGPWHAELTKVPWLARVDDLNLTNNYDLGRWLDDFLNAAPLPNLRSLTLRNDGLFADDVRALARHAARMPRLTRLDLSGVPLADEGFATITETPGFGRLTELIVRCDRQSWHNSIHTAGAAAFARGRHLPPLRLLDLGGHYVGSEGLAALLASPLADTLEELGVRGDGFFEGVNENEVIGDAAIVDLTAADFPRLRRLDLSRNPLGYEAAAALIHWPHLPRMEWVDLTGIEWGVDARALLAASPYADRFKLDEQTYSV